jgi:ABC-type Fe3+/spermidine/putrescine transport system ATPase subunit
LPITRGRVLIDGRDISEVPPRLRGVGYVFQDGALWPHMAVGEHVAFGLRQQRRPGDEISRRVAMVLGRLGLASVERVKPAELTLEQRRRLALARRALAVEPQVLLLDEPLANLDPTARKALRLELTKLHRDLAVTTVHATETPRTHSRCRIVSR